MKESTFRIRLSDNGVVGIDAGHFEIEDGILRINRLNDKGFTYPVVVFARGAWQYFAIEEIGTQDKGFPNV